MIKSLEKKNFLKKRKLKINNFFGPVKFNSKKFLTIHLMIYDVNGHKKHCTNSPFTCFDWQKSAFYKGKSLKNIYPIFNIQFRDFFEARRNSLEYMNDLEKNIISIRKYIFKKNRYF